MNNRFTIDQLSKSETIDPNSINRLYKINKMLDFMEIRSNNPRMTQKQICNQLGTSDSTIKRYRNDINMDSPYNRNNYKRKKPKQTPINSNINDTKSVLEEDNRNKRIEKRIKNKLKGGNISDTHSLSGNELIDQAFINDKNTILENNKKDNTKLVTIARRLADEYYKKTHIIVCILIIFTHIRVSYY